MNPDPLAYLITFTCYGTWLRGQAPGSVDREHNQYGTPVLPPNPTRQRVQQDRLLQEPYHLDGPRRRHVLEAIQEVCTYRRWSLLAAHVRTNHVHVVVRAEAAPEKVMNDLKVYASRRLNKAGLDGADRQRWTRHGSTQYIWNLDHLLDALDYVVNRQGDPLEVFITPEAESILSRVSEPRPLGSGGAATPAP